MMKIKTHNPLLIKGLVLIAAFLWGLSFAVLKEAITDFAIFWVLTIRFFIGSVFFALLFFKRLKCINKEVIVSGSLMGVCIFLAYVFQTIGLDHTTPGKNAFLTSVYCIFVPFLCFFIFRHRLDKYHIIGAIICLFGIAFISIDELSINFGDVFSLIGGFFFAIHILVSTKVTQKNDPVLCVLFQMIFVCLLCFIVSLIFEFPQITFQFALKGWLQILFLGIGPSALCLFFQALGNKHLHPNTVSIILATEAVFGVLFSVFLGFEKLTLFIIFGFILVFIAIIISESKLSFLNKKFK